MAAHAMILGCGRSGTSIFGELFDGLDCYEYRSEPAFSDVLQKGFATPTAYKVPTESSGYEATPGLSFPLGTYLAAAPDPKIFWIVRHPLDAICSLRVGIAKNWGHHPQPPDWRAWLDRPVLERCAHHWAFLNTAGFSQVEPVAITVTFEDMITDPRRFAENICRVVGVDVASNRSHIDAWARRVQDTNNARFIEAQTSRDYSRPDHERKVGRWRENLSDQEVASVWPIVEGPAIRFGYACR